MFFTRTLRETYIILLRLVVVITSCGCYVLWLLRLRVTLTPCVLLLGSFSHCSVAWPQFVGTRLTRTVMSTCPTARPPSMTTPSTHVMLFARSPCPTASRPSETTHSSPAPWPGSPCLTASPPSVATPSTVATPLPMSPCPTASLPSATGLSINASLYHRSLCPPASSPSAWGPSTNALP